MYEYTRRIRNRPLLLGLGDNDDGTPGMQLALDYRSGAKTMPEIRDICMRVSPSRYHTDYDECRWFLTPEELCSREHSGRQCTEEELRQQCFMTPQQLRHNRCFFYLDQMSSEEITASNAGPTYGYDASVLQRAAGTVSRYRQTVAEAAENVVRTLRAADTNVQALQRAVIAGGCSLSRYGADGRWGPETETGVRCLAERQGWHTVLQQWPWIAQRFTVPSEQAVPTRTQVAAGTALPKPSEAPTIAPIVTETQPSIQTASMFPSFRIAGLPSWAPWTLVGLGLFSFMALGMYLTRNKRR